MERQVQQARQVRLPGNNLLHEGDQILLAALRQQLVQGCQVLDAVWFSHQGEQGGNDVLAHASPVVGAGAAGVGDAVRPKGGGHAIGISLATSDLGGDGVASLLYLPHSSRCMVLFAALKVLSYGHPAHV
jgi:hypothetical protein